MATLGDLFWTAGSFFTNPGANTTLVQSASLTPGPYQVNITVYCTTMAMLVVQHIDTDGTTIIKSQRVAIDISSFCEIKGWKVEITKNGQKIRIVNNDALVGDIQVSLN